ncbi:ATP-binding cassette, subfamily B [Halolactibacillus halophilus]|uniref:ABC transporter n=1 Tax=Halolactibacillus halophilus TaxID=306540 RepID=A0A1I5QTW4_9BACI|nr:ABC transporter ATP-binding protein [Halolactibacillus halophilus]GEM01917.1 ABC transporter [Halolactibacillus halophilus]SFP49580.1 ATP-binding cassette, subfamily B [Halolactibacillus halophilus]
MIKTLISQLKEYKLPSYLTIIFAVFEVATDVAIPFIMALIIDRGINNGDLSQIYLYGGIMLVTVMIGLVSGALAAKFAAEASTGYAHNLREAMFENVQTFSFSNIDNFSTSGLVTRMTTDVTNMQNSYQMIIRLFIRFPLMLVSALVMSFIIAPKIGLVFLIVSIFLGLALALIIKLAMPIYVEVFAGYDDLNASVQENITGIRVVKGFAREPYEKGKFGKTVENLFRKFVKAESLLAFNNPIMMFAIYGSMLGLSWLGANMVVGGSLTTGQLTSLFTYLMNILMSLMILTMVFITIIMSTASARRIAEVIDEKADIVNPNQPLMKVADGSIRFEHVNFSYKKGSEKYVLSDINLTIQSGQTIGIIGATGSSKSSLINLVSRLYDVNEGSVKVGGKDVRDYDLETLRNEVAVVLQNNELFSGTIIENLRWGNKEASYEACVEAAKMACAHDFIESFPDSYNTYIEQGGSNVSGGQKQRLCIARALLKEPKILILDDSTSAVDTATDMKIRKSLSDSISATTKLIITQRIASIAYADSIIVLDDGRVNGYGTHEELLDSNEIYTTIYKNQEKGFADFDEKGA